MRMFGRPRGALGRLGGLIMARTNQPCAAGVIDLLMLIGYYYSLAHTMGALEVGPPPGVPSTLLR